MKWRWVLAILAVTSAIAVALTVTLPSGVPFDFLPSQSRVRVNTSEDVAEMYEGMGLEHSVYSFRADFDELAKRADKELTSKGYKPCVFVSLGGEGKAYSSPGPGSSPPAPNSESMAPQVVHLLRDARFRDSDQQDEFGTWPLARGWVSVVVLRSRPRSLLDRFRDWL